MTAMMAVLLTYIPHKGPAIAGREGDTGLYNRWLWQGQVDKSCVTGDTDQREDQGELEGGSKRFRNFNSCEVDMSHPLSAVTNWIRRVQYFALIKLSLHLQFSAKASFSLILILLDTDERYDGDIRPGEDNGIPVTTNNSQLHETDTTYTALENPRHHK